MIESIESIDRALLLLINGSNTPFLDSFFWYLSKPISGLLLYVFIIFFCFYKRKVAKGFLYLLIIILAIGLADFISVHCFKNVFLRYRPSHNLDIKENLHIIQNYRGGMYGFVSSHAATMFAFATSVSLVFKLKYLTSLVFIWAILVSYSRMYLGVHYPLDIIGGALVGSTISLIIIYGIKKRKIEFFERITQ